MAIKKLKYSTVKTVFSSTEDNKEKKNAYGKHIIFNKTLGIYFGNIEILINNNTMQ